jgi:quercetin dioxygenase-like cupin family protein
MTRLHEPRRHADGALDIGYYRRRAARIRHLARRRAWEAVCRPLPLLSPRRLAAGSLAALACAVAVAARAEPPPAAVPGGFTSLMLHAAPLEASPWWVFRMHRVELGQGTETARAMPLGDEIVLVTEGSIVIEVEGEAPRLLRAGQAFQYRPMAPHVTRNASGGLPAVLIVSSVSGVGLPAGMPLAGLD